VKTVVVPKSWQMIGPGWMPVNVAIGTSTCGVRTPPTPLPCSSVTIETGGPRFTSSRGANFGALPLRTHLFSAEIAAFTTKCCGPELIGKPQSRMPGTGDDGALMETMSGDVPRSVMPPPVRYESACDVPATSHKRKFSASSWRATV
jgi:hypothetical protein